MPVSLLGSMRAHQAEAGTHHEPVVHVPSEIVPVPSSAAPGDIAPVPAEVFAGSPPQNDASTLPGSDTNNRLD